MSISRLDEQAVSPGFVCHTLALSADLLDLQRAQPRRYPHLLESVCHGTPQARYDILFAFPRRTLTLLSGGRLMRDDRPAGFGDFLEAFDREWQECRQSTLSAAHTASTLPFTGGWFVYLGYELVSQIESRLGGMTTDQDLPVANVTRFPAAIIRDRVGCVTHLVCELDAAQSFMPKMEEDFRYLASYDETAIELAKLTEEEPERYLDSVKRTLAYIGAGDVFQVNLSRTWEALLDRPVSAAALYSCLRRANPAPFAGLMMLDQDTAVVSSSPERLVRVDKRRISTRPIAGTYPRSPDREQDRRWSQELLGHPKERAEHVMLIDLERNDLGRVCRTGSVHVNEFMVLETYSHVHHIVSEVSGVLSDDVTPAQIIRAVFPGGTITGCPKVRCMEIISELECTPRGPYTGSMGYINRDGSMDLNILIRTMVLQGDHIRLRAGAGIVADSKPLRELQETRAKAKGMLAALGCT